MMGRKLCITIWFFSMPFSKYLDPFKIAYDPSQGGMGVIINCVITRLHTQKLTVQQEGFPRLTVYL